MSVVPRMWWIVHLVMVMMLSSAMMIVLPVTAVSEALSRHQNYTKRFRREAANEAAFSQEDKDAIVRVHNHIRADVTGASNMMAVEWNTDLEEEAKRWASLCDFEHPHDRRIIGGFDGIGQNLFLSSYDPTADQPIHKWGSEALNYIHGTLSCGSGKICGHYTQVIWAETTAIGCAREYCDPVTSAGPIKKGYFVVCEYGPSGNQNGADPYRKGAPCSHCPSKYKFCVQNLCSMKSSASTSWTQQNTSSMYRDKMLMYCIVFYMCWQWL